MKKITLLLAVLFHFVSFAQSKIVQSPSSFLGYEIGERFTRHASLTSYINHVASVSDWVTLHTYGTTNEYRPLHYLVVTSPENQTQIETIRKNHLNSILPTNKNSNTQEKAIVWLSYNVHGNEASASEASMQTLYELVTQKQDWLRNTIVIIDPCLNPDGRDRYVNWYNQVKSTPYIADQNATEHNEPWPGGRFNHYLFDLNRDWAWATQVETNQRLAIYNKWMPHIHVDFHEQGINDPYYFAPAAEPFHEVITDWQKDFQTLIGKNHAKYFDQNGWLYFTRERFDLLYPSYGDTYPTFMGAIGMTYEQAGHGRAGLGIQTDEGYVLTLKDRVKHHTTTGISTIEIASKNAKKLNTEFRKFFNNTNFKYKSYILQGDSDRLELLAKLLDKHEIKYGYSNGTKVSGFDFIKNKTANFTTNNALVVSTNQLKGKMVKVLFEPEAQLKNPITYDITAWSLPYAYGLQTIGSTTLISGNETSDSAFSKNISNRNTVGYITKWNSMQDATFLADLLQHKVKVRFSEKDFDNNGKHFKKGSLIITKSDNRTLKNYDSVVIAISNTHKRKLHAATSGFSNNGYDFGSPEIKLINAQNIAVLKGKYTNPLSYGAIWHFFEQELQYPITAIDTDYFKSTPLHHYNVLVIPDGQFKMFFDTPFLEKLKKWVSAGGTVISMGASLEAFANKKGFDLTKNTVEEKDSINKLIPYEQREQNAVKNLITGSIFKTKVDNSHPLAFGYDNTYFSLKIGSNSYSLLKKGYNVAYIQNPERISGYAGAKALKGLKNSIVFGETKIGKGSMIYMVDNPLFRGFWEHGKLFFVNALFMTNNNPFRI